MWQEIIKANVDDRIDLFVDNADEIFRRDFARQLNAFESATGLDPLPDSVQFENNLELKINYKSDAEATDFDFAFNFEIDGGIYITTDGEIEDGPRRAFQQYRYDDSDLDEGVFASFDKKENFEFRVNFNNFYREGQQYVLKDGKIGLTLDASVTRFNSSEMKWVVEIVISRD